ncbi:hypothetical protein FE374_14000 [Georgenia yuyongxinii]|uniref:SHOCT domain-containing protein n=1 Tax=Georgenia yuyongxinii TaxID=2589797 RepID=A0A5B8C5R2_9MICO|nr:hypothetical protein [Georgenia yuyongxinii]QDC25567.1 hypothetical protein FE374_14000 [Georgenia yuyongxinii]
MRYNYGVGGGLLLGIIALLVVLLMIAAIVVLVLLAVRMLRDGDRPEYGPGGPPGGRALGGVGPGMSTVPGMGVPPGAGLAGAAAPAPSAVTSRQVLDDRLARGEIGMAEYEELRHRLES